MAIDLVFKSKLLNELSLQLDKKINTLNADILATVESRNNDTKSSAGDKFETGREMMQAELNKNQLQLDKNLKAKHDLNKIDSEQIFTKVEFGSLVITNLGNYFISLPLGRVTVDSEEVYCISLASPIGQAMANKSIADAFTFNGRSLTIEKIY